MDKQDYSIENLVDITGISRRTIRFYIAEGLLEPPAGRGRGGFYNDSHLKRLNDIKALQEKGFALSSIKEIKDTENPPLPEVIEREVWIRLFLAEGVELHVSRTAEDRNRRSIHELIKFAGTIFKDGGNNDE
jgi:DNA-binding transcriptional MerR regulator